MAPPDTLIFEDKEIACWTFAQLERLSKGNLKQRTQAPSARSPLASLSPRLS